MFGLGERHGAGQMPKLVVGDLVDQGRLAHITLPDGAEVLRSAAAGSLEQLAVRLDDELAPIFAGLTESSTPPKFPPSSAYF